MTNNPIWQDELEQFNKNKLTEPVFITTDLNYEDAEYLLENNEGNRNLLERYVGAYESFMNEGKWLLNGECLKVAPDGRLLDGQHRMEALRRCKKPIRMSLALGVNPNTFAVNDTGKSRNASDILAMAGYKNVNQNAAAMRYFLWYKRSESFGAYSILTPNLILESFKKFPHMVHFATPAKQVSHLGPGSFFQFFIYLTQTIDAELSYDFFYKLETGEKLTKTSSILQLRNTLLSYSAKNLRIDKRHLVAMVIITWNSYVEKTRIKTVRWQGGDFPIITAVNRKKLYKAGSGFGKD